MSIELTEQQQRALDNVQEEPARLVDPRTNAAYALWGILDKDRVFPSSHTNPIFVLVGDKPIRASKRSAEWCLKTVDQCWKQKVRNIREREREEARAAYDKAREEYKKVLEECKTD